MYTHPDAVSAFSRQGKPKALAALLVLLTLFLPQAARADGCRFINHGSRESMQIALTFDDLWDADIVAEILDIAEAHGAHITLFPCGGAINREDGALWRRALYEGHEIGNHSTSHKDFTSLGSSSVAWQLETMQKRLDDALGYHYTVKYVRTPYGSGRAQGSGGQVGRAIFGAGYEYVIFWDVDETSAEDILRKAKSGSIVVMHGIRRDVKMLSGLMAGLQARGYDLVTIGELMGITARTSRERYYYAGFPESGAPVVLGKVTITARAANIRTGCSKDAALLHKAAKGDVFALLGIDKETGWYALLLSDGTTGYIAEGMMKAEFFPLQ